MVELPLALPVIMAGVRTAAVWVIGTATLSTPIGQTSLGNYIFAGLQTQNWVLRAVRLRGCGGAGAGRRPAAGADRARLRRTPGRGWRPAPPGSRSSLAGWRCCPMRCGRGGGYVIGAKPFAEQYILAALIEDRLRAKGLAAGRRDGLGSAVILDALAAGDIDAYVDYSGTIWANQMQRTDVLPRAEVLEEVGSWLKDAARHRDAGRARLRERLRAGHEARARAPARHPLDRRPGAATRRACRLPATTSSSAGRNGRRSATPTASPSAASGRCRRSSCIRPRRPARWT